ncbi:hypothetical protein EYF80_034085 [Liparis tanakae]|uniref:Uncharacterized protein n=1 Tax=Liparis tanakae TaxID=230148 RepID=A0A4Z2GR50_9TELE|nr:hypothetical protein EYF80_034085 [Liparis tanakae]
MVLLEVSGSWAETLPIEVPTRASSETTILPSGVEKTGGSFTSSTVNLTDVVSLNGPALRKLESMFLFVASILREKLLFVSKSRGCERSESESESETVLLAKFDMPYLQENDDPVLRALLRRYVEHAGPVSVHDPVVHLRVGADIRVGRFDSGHRRLHRQ